jgi:hypothetical protein
MLAYLNSSFLSENYSLKKFYGKVTKEYGKVTKTLER